MYTQLNSYNYVSTHCLCIDGSRLHQVAKLYMYSPSSGLYSCPLAMTDGAAKLIEVSARHSQFNYVGIRILKSVLRRESMELYV